MYFIFAGHVELQLAQFVGISSVAVAFFPDADDHPDDHYIKEAIPNDPPDLSGPI